MNRPVQHLHPGPADALTRPAHDPGSQGAVLLQAVAIGYWLAFWAMNGLDKFLNRTDLGAFTWYGKDRSAQFSEYFERLGWAPEAIPPLLAWTGAWELAIALPLAMGLGLVITGRWATRRIRLIDWGFVLSAVTLIGFSVFDVVAGDRAELREHGLYLALLMICWLIGTGRAGTLSQAPVRS